MPVCQIALGGNVGSVQATLDGAIAALGNQEGVSVVAVSSCHRTAAVGDRAASDFLNAACTVSTNLPPLELLNVLQSVESRFGRRRDQHWGPRTLDLDLIFYNSQVIDLPRLIVPHPAAWYRRFVLDPLVEIAPDFIHPVKQVSVRELRSRLLRRPLRVALTGGITDEAELLSERLADEFPAVQFCNWHWNVPADVKGEEPTFIVWLGPGSDAGRTDAQMHNDSAMGAESGPSRITFRDLPLLPRIDATAAQESPETFLRHLLQSAG